MAWCAAGIVCKLSIPAPTSPLINSTCNSNFPILDKPVTLRESKIAVLQPMTLAEQVAFVQNEDGSEFRHKRRAWPWAIAALLLLLLLILQSAYFFRVDLAAQLPGLKPALIDYCRILKCTVPLPQHTELMSIESSGLED